MALGLREPVGPFGAGFAEASIGSRRPLSARRPHSARIPNAGAAAAAPKEPWRSGIPQGRNLKPVLSSTAPAAPGSYLASSNLEPSADRAVGSHPPATLVDLAPMRVTHGGDPHGRPSAARVYSQSRSSVEQTEPITQLACLAQLVREKRDLPCLWRTLHLPLKTLVPCEDVSIVVRSIGPPPRQEACQGPFNKDVRQYIRGHELVKYVEQWSPHRIEGAAAIRRQVCCIPSTDAERHQWAQYECGSSVACGSGKVDNAHEATFDSPFKLIRCLAAVPLYDEGGCVIAVVKFTNRLSSDRIPLMQFSPADLRLLQAMADIVQCAIPGPYLGMPGAGVVRPPQAQVSTSDDKMGALVSWQLPQEMGDLFVHEICYTAFSGDPGDIASELSEDNWRVVPCGVLQPIMIGSASRSATLERHFEFEVHGLQADTYYAFRVRVGNVHKLLPWSQASPKFSTALAPPHPGVSESVDVCPVSDTAVQITWHPLNTSSPRLRAIEYRVVASGNARTGTPNGEGPLVHVSDVFTSSGNAAVESVTLSGLRSCAQYRFEIQARYPRVGTREFALALELNDFTFPGLDFALSAPQLLAPDAPAEWQNGAPDLFMLKWPYSGELERKLTLQYRTAYQAERDHVGRPRLQVSCWVEQKLDDVQKLERVEGDAVQKYCALHLPSVQSGLAVQLRVLTKSPSNGISPLSSWFYPKPVEPPSNVSLNMIVSEMNGVALQICWNSRMSTWGVLGEGSTGLSICHDFASGFGPDATRFQLRLRQLPHGDAQVREAGCSWRELEPQMLPTAEKGADGAATGLYKYLLRESQWFLQGGMALEAEIRLGNALFWSSWSPGGRIAIGARPPVPGTGQILRVEGMGLDSARLEWLPFSSGWPELRALEYRVMCLELRADDRCEASEGLHDWRTLEIITRDGSQSESVMPLECLVRSLLPERSYRFAVESRYAGLPAKVAQSAVGRLEALNPLPSRAFMIVMGRLAADASIQYGASDAETLGPARFGLRLDWTFRAAPAGVGLPGTLLYQIRATPYSPGAALALGVVGEDSTILLPSALLQQQEAGVEKAVAGDWAGFSTTTPGSGTACAMLSGSALEPLTRVGRALLLEVRMAHPESGAWSDWAQLVGSPVELMLPPPVAAPRSSLEVTENLWASENLMPAESAHAVQHVQLSWLPFQPTTGANPDWHSQLCIEYEVTAWVANAKEHANAEVDANVAFRRSVRCPPVGAARRNKLQPDSGDLGLAPVQCMERVSAQVPGETLTPWRQHFFTVSARYVFANGAPVPTPSSLESMTMATGSLVSAVAFCPTPRLPAASALELSNALVSEASSSGGVVLTFPDPDNILDTFTPPQVEVRAGYGTPGSIQASGGWLPCDSEVIAVPPARPQLLLKALPAKVCQFRLCRGSVYSLPTSWVDAEVWCPPPLYGPVLNCADGRPAAETFPGAIQAMSDPSGQVILPTLSGFGVALRLAGDALSAWLAWPRVPPGDHAVEITGYQVSFCAGEEDWDTLPEEEIRPSSLPVAECHVMELKQGASYLFSLRLCNALGVWSSWSQPAPPLVMKLPAPVPGRCMPEQAIHVKTPTCSSVKLGWRPFCIPKRQNYEEAPPIMLDDNSRLANAEYEVTVRAEGGRSIATIVSPGLVWFEEIPSHVADLPWLEVEVESLEPQQVCTFEIRARMPTTTWGEILASAALPARILPISVATPGLDFALRVATEQAGAPFEAFLQLECCTHGFAGGAPPQGHSGLGQDLQLVAKAANLARIQVRSAAADADTERRLEPWREWPDVPVDPEGGVSPLRCKVPLPSVAVCMAGQYVFSVRCSDEFGRWTSWSGASSMVSVAVPPISLSGLQVEPVGRSDARLQWDPCTSAGGIELGPMEYRLHMMQVGKGSGGRRILLGDVRSEQGAGGQWQHEVHGLDPHTDYVFLLAARPTAVPQWLNGYEWGPEVSARLPASARNPEAA